jgi:outer membrane protein assembly factor BamE
MRLLALAAMLLVSACGPFVYRIEVQQGNVVAQEAVAQLKPGMTKVEVRQIMGTPLLTDVFHANRWDYYFSLGRGGRTQERQLVSLHFQDEKLVSITGDVKAAAPRPAAPAAAAK